MHPSCVAEAGERDGTGADDRAAGSGAADAWAGDAIAFGGSVPGPKDDADETIEALFHAHYPSLVYTAFCLTGDRALAEQLTQEAYLRLWRRWRWIADPQAAPFYLRRTVINLARQTLRRTVLERRVLRSTRMEPADQHETDPAEVLALRQAIAALPARKRECVVLRYLIGLTEAETARVLGVSAGTVKSQTHKGLAQLRERLDGPAGAAGAAGPATAPERSAT